MENNIPWKGHQEFRGRDEEGDCLPDVETLGVGSGVCEMTKRLVFLC